MSMPSAITTTYLEMFEPPDLGGLEQPKDTLILRSEQPTVPFYRFLYNTVGGPWHWHERRKLTDEQLGAILSGPIELYVLYHRGTPAGYSELEVGDPSVIKLAYFGLMPEYTGMGLGRFWLQWTVRQAWRPGTERVWVHTCTLDHEAALPLYQKVGFQIYDRRTERNPYL